MQQQPNQLSPWQAWSLDVAKQLQCQQESITALEQQLAAICEQLKKLEAKPTYNVENLQYHFDQLKVEKLEGTLNIGMTPQGSPDMNGDIEQMAISKPLVYPAPPNGAAHPTDPYAPIQNDLNQYIDNEGAQKLMQMEKQFCMPLDPHHRRLILSDIRSQMPARIQYYARSLPRQDGVSEETAAQQNRAEVFAKTARDADAAMLQYMQQLQNGGVREAHD
ncbi:hypothetical protein BBD42_20840 [Paenibacillus sp. BIHB 4019]|uniref:Uncharacterized protein n=1 Tax=Paenibacillus sp. BIHB 4019 TaxID=1870819 RepID=A0A1B2DLQ2_9BACL|nr:spore germination protein GerPC [Paenibacillus sp. BIHB 4019]ANY68644.1 hypothetical protein BBD42_20840 [Paenibacillus sp. BIHB 4019]